MPGEARVIRIPNEWQPRPYQVPLWRYLEHGGKRAVAVWHRRAGKDDVCLHWTACAMMSRPATYWHMLPEASQARKAIWEAVNPHTGKKRIDEAFPLEIRAVTREQEMMIKFRNGATWQVVGSDNYDSLIGSPPVGLVYSEWAVADPTSWAYLMPILEENGGWALWVYTPRGSNHGKTTFDLATERMGAANNWFSQLLTVDDTKIFSTVQLDEIRQSYTKQYGPSRGEALFRQEFYCSWTAAFTGKSVYTDKEFVRTFHVSKLPLLPLVHDNIKNSSNRTVYRGWDHTGLHPACVVTYLTGTGQWMVFKEFWEDNCGIEDFVLQVKTWCATNLPSRSLFKDWGDPAGNRTRDSRKKTPAQYIRETHGISIQEGIQTFKIRRESVGNMLTRQIMGGPALVVDPTQCPLLLDGFLGGYGYQEIGKNTGIFKDEPQKDMYADVHDALQYAASRLFGPSKRTSGNKSDSVTDIVSAFAA